MYCCGRTLLNNLFRKRAVAAAHTAWRACREELMALESGVPTKTHILNLLHRLIDGKPLATPPITAPQALRLVSEPLANVERYDALRGENRHAS